MNSKQICKILGIAVFLIGMALPVIFLFDKGSIDIIALFFSATLTGPMFLASLVFGLRGDWQKFITATIIGAVGAIGGMVWSHQDMLAAGGDGQAGFSIFLLYLISPFVLVLSFGSGWIIERMRKK